MKHDYTKKDVVDALARLGFEKGDVLLMHSDIARTGLPEGFDRSDRDYLPRFIYEAIREVIGAEGTLVAPTFSYSFCNREIFDPDKTPGKVGEFGNWLRRQPGAMRNEDPNFSFCALGPKAGDVFHDLSNNSFDLERSVLANLKRLDACLLSWGLKASHFTCGHFGELHSYSPNRYKKLFAGLIKKGDSLRKETWIYPVRVNVPNSTPDDQAFTDFLLEDAIAAALPLGRSCLIGASFNDVIFGTKKRRDANMWSFLKGPTVDLAEEDRKRSGWENHSVHLNSCDLKEMAAKLTPLPRHLISDGYDAALFALQKILPLEIHEYPTGMEALTWIVPERWICRSASLKRVNGDPVFSKADDQFHVMSYSLPKKGKVTRAELFEHLHTHPRHEDAIPFSHKYYEKDWGLCVSQKQKAQLTDPEYVVDIDTDFTFGSLKVGELVVPGQKDDCIVFCAHLCHPGQLADGLSGVLAGIKLFEWLQTLEKPLYTYRLLILPETIGSAAWLSRNKNLWPYLKGGLFLEMLSTNVPYHTLMRSNQPESYFDKVIAGAVKSADQENELVPFLHAPMNDERMFNGAGIECPMCSLMRILPEDHIDWPFPEYHTNQDNLENNNLGHLDKSVDLLKEIVYAFENDAVPHSRFFGEIMVSRYNSLDYAKMGKVLRHICFAIDGKRSMTEIASRINQPFRIVKETLDAMKAEGLISFTPIPVA